MLAPAGQLSGYTGQLWPAQTPSRRAISAGQKWPASNEKPCT